MIQGPERIKNWRAALCFYLSGSAERNVRCRSFVRRGCMRRAATTAVPKHSGKRIAADGSGTPASVPGFNESDDAPEATHDSDIAATFLWLSSKSTKIPVVARSMSTQGVPWSNPLDGRTLQQSFGAVAETGPWFRRVSWQVGSSHGRGTAAEFGAVAAYAPRRPLCSNSRFARDPPVTPSANTGPPGLAAVELLAVGTASTADATQPRSAMHAQTSPRA